MNAKELAISVVANLPGSITMGPTRPAHNDYVQFACHDEDGNSFTVKIIQMNADDGKPDNTHDCVATDLENRNE